MEPRPAPSLPLDWTRVSRKRPADCCVGGVCPHRRSRPVVNRRTTTTPTTSGGGGTNPEPTKQVYYHTGQVIVCLLEPNPDWFQAYLFLNNGATWGLLGTQKEIDECLQCSEGGYRVIDLKVVRHDHTFTDVEWTGGDMMDLKGHNVRMQADQIWTGPAAVPVVERVFGSLVQRARQGQEEPLEVLEVFPELAIVVGHMELALDAPPDDDLRNDTTT